MLPLYANCNHAVLPLHQSTQLAQFDHTEPQCQPHPLKIS